MADQWVCQISPTDDTFVDNANPNQQFGDEFEIYIGNLSGGQVRRAYLKFDISSIPEGATIVDAELVLTVSGESDCNISAHNVFDCSWNEDSITWDTAPIFDPHATVDVFFFGGSAYSFAWTVTPDVTLAYSELDSDKTYCTMLKLHDESVNGYVVARTKESTGLGKPYLEITYVPEPATMSLLAVGGLSVLAYAWRRRRN